MVDNVMPKKTQTKTYVLGLLPKTPSFRNLSDNDAELVLPKSKFVGSNRLPLAKSHVSESCSFKPVRLFALDMDLAVVSGKTNSDKLMAAFKLAAIGSTPVFKNVNLHWAGLSLVCCAHCKQFGHISTGCLLGGNSGACGKQVVTPQNWACLANIYKKKQAPIVYPVFFGEKTWAQVAGGSFSHEILSNSSGVGSFLGAKPVSLLLVDQISDILKKLSFVELVPLASSSCVFPPVTIVFVTADGDLDMNLDVVTVSPSSLLSAVADSVAGLSSSSSKVLTTKMGGLESKMVALKVLVESVLERLDCLCSELDLSTSLAL
ncbi:hypothetical protein G9A89_013269 [Geosiphon pyriformis]|nr:hypothetical protein G9A89_013269 [Geosiphon pyriformis]